MIWIQVFRVWHRNFLIFQRTWLVSLFWILLEPIFMLGAIGYGVGAAIDKVENLPYAEFFFPGLLCISSMMVAFFESSYGNFTKLIYSKVYSAQLLSPLTVEELIMGDLLWGASKGVLSALGILVVGAFLGLGWSPWVVLVLPLIFLNAWIFSCAGMLVTSWARNYDQIIYPTSGIIVPMSLFSGTYFSLTEAPQALQYLSYLLPLTHVVQICRQLLVDGNRVLQDPLFAVHFLVVLSVAMLMTRFAVQRMVQRLNL